MDRICPGSPAPVVSIPNSVRTGCHNPLQIPVGGNHMDEQMFQHQKELAEELGDLIHRLKGG